MKGWLEVFFTLHGGKVKLGRVATLIVSLCVCVREGELVCAFFSDLQRHYDTVKADWTLKVQSKNLPSSILGSAPL